jgi:hypothetical protein
MEKNYFYLGTSDDNKLIKIIRIAFGIICIVVAVFWVIFNISQLNNNLTTWITILFLSGFGIYQIWSGLGYTKVFIEVGAELIRLKNNPVLPVRNIVSADIKNIEMYPLSIFIFVRSGRKYILRFGTTYPDIIDEVKDAVIIFSEKNTISLEIIEEEL